MSTTRVIYPIQGPDPIFGWVKFNDQWAKVRILTFILQDMVSKNEVEFEDGTKKIVLNDSIKFGRKPKK